MPPDKPTRSRHPLKQSYVILASSSGTHVSREALWNSVLAQRLSKGYWLGDAALEVSGYGGPRRATEIAATRAQEILTEPGCPLLRDEDGEVDATRLSAALRMGLVDLDALPEDVRAVWLKDPEEPELDVEVGLTLLAAIEEYDARDRPGSEPSVGRRGGPGTPTTVQAAASSVRN